MVNVYKRMINTLVGLFMLAGIGGLLVLAYKVSSFSHYEKGDSYILTADFDNVGGLKVRAPVEIGGVKIGQVDSITLDPNTFKAKVTMSIDDKANNIPVDTSASILTQGLLGSNYINFMPGFSPESLKEGDTIDTTHSALILENLIGQLMFKLNSSDSSASASAADINSPAAATGETGNGNATSTTAANNASGVSSEANAAQNSIANTTNATAAAATNDSVKSTQEQLASTAKSNS